MYNLKWLKPSNIFRLQVKFGLPDDFYMLAIAAFVGVVGGFTLVAYHHLLDGVNHFFFNTFVGWFPETIMEYIPIIIPAIGGMAISLIFLKIDRYPKEYGAPAIMDCVVNNNGYMQKRLPTITFFASILCIATGGSVGKEGPSILIGAGIASFIGTTLKLGSDRTRLLVGAGAATGLAAAFNVPIAAAIFALEIIMADFSVRAFGPVIIASVFATTISRMFILDAPVFQITDYSLNSPLELPLYLILGLIGGYLSVFVIKSHKKVHNFFKNLNIPVFWKPILGGLIIGIAGYFFKETYGFDDNVINEVLRGNYTITVVLVLLCVKIIATHITIGSGGIGGLFTPVLIIGASFGFAFGIVVNELFGFTAPPGAYAMVGMAVLVTGVQHAMLSSIMIIFECTSDYEIMLPLMIGVVPAILISRMINKDSIYTMQFSYWGDRIARGRNVEILEKMDINTVINERADKINECVPLLGIIHSFMNSRSATFPVVRENDELVGIISLRDIQEIMFDEHVHSLLIAQDCATTNVLVIEDSENFEDAFRKLDVGDFESLPVVYTGTNTLRGMISRDDLMKRYRKELLFSGS